jgi:superfamily I DNA/RNA helicase
LIKGVAGSGKTTVAVSRIRFLLSNYCFVADDRILLVTFNKTLVNYIKYLYKKVEDEIGVNYLNLFSGDGDKLDDKVDILTIDRILYKYFMDYKKGYLPTANTLERNLKT